MSRPVITIEGTFPRLGAKASEKTAITTRTNTAGQWQSDWDNRVVSYCNSAVAKTDAALAAEGDLDKKFFSLGMGGWIDGTSSFHTKLRDAALHLASNSGLWFSFTARRDQIIGLAFAYDFLRAGGAGVSFSDANRKTIGDALIAMCTATGSASEKIDGHSGGNLQAQLMAGLTLYNESGSGFNYTTSAANIVNAALDFWYGATAGAACRMDTPRYFCSDGGQGKGNWYNVLAFFFEMLVLNSLKNACSSITLDGSPYDPMVDEDWVGKAGEWWVRAFSRGGDKDFLTIGDSDRTYVNPFFDYRARVSLAVLIRHGGAFRKQVRWLRDRVNTAAATSPYSLTSSDFAWEVATWAPEDANNASQSPKAAGWSKGRLFDPPGDFIYDSDLDQDGTGTKIHIQCHELEYAGHTHLAQGGMQVEVNGDMVLLFSGAYATSDPAADFGGPHHRGWLQQSIGHSGVPLIHDPTYDTAPLAHKAHNSSGTLVDWRSGLGGQMWHRFDLGGGSFSYDPPDVGTMRFQGGSMAWRHAGVDAAGTKKLRIVSSVLNKYTYLHADYTRAYQREHTDLGGANERVSLVETGWIIVEDVSSRPVILRIDRVKSKKATSTKRLHWHAHGAWTNQLLDFGTDQFKHRLEATGFRGTGKVVVDVHNLPSVGVVRETSSWPNDLSTITGPSKTFTYDTIAFNPSVPPNPRRKPDFSREWVYVHKTGELEDWFMSMIQPLGVGEAPASYEFIRDGTNIGARFGATAEYLVNMQTFALISDTDTSPPAVPVMKAAFPGPAGGQITTEVFPNSDAPKKYRYWYRQKV